MPSLFPEQLDWISPVWLDKSQPCSLVRLVWLNYGHRFPVGLQYLPAMPLYFSSQSTLLSELTFLILNLSSNIWTRETIHLLSKSKCSWEWKGILIDLRDNYLGNRLNQYHSRQITIPYWYLSFLLTFIWWFHGLFHREYRNNRRVPTCQWLHLQPCTWPSFFIQWMVY